MGEDARERRPHTSKKGFEDVPDAGVRGYLRSQIRDLAEGASGGTRFRHTGFLTRGVGYTSHAPGSPDSKAFVVAEAVLRDEA